MLWTGLGPRSFLFSLSLSSLSRSRSRSRSRARSRSRSRTRAHTHTHTHRHTHTHELFFPVMSDDSSPVRGPRSPRAESPRHRPPAQPAHLATLAQTKTFRSLAASRPSQGVEQLYTFIYNCTRLYTTIVYNRTQLYTTLVYNGIERIVVYSCLQV